ncbi:MAG: carbon-nitrogen hydrolase family protein [Sulfuricurvum sp.]|uniref:carbon-nitrogen hydrolase family protein n=1 Tax=Sulfuricurvum sp. TaxID=2025608 RepID=UPI00262F5CF8|nr:carbon-nitrogen hydrolase family protein [Sulfuricurvum sp.]MDD2828410.1 carbon-nitrogen hydrolase family protein [Sulfuricurvum sp.]MDD4949415.1 carbon-nitrogen hydrolase family protein [Sulfuricurvum sp.]
MTSKPLVSLCLSTEENFENNLTRLILHIVQSPEDAIIVAPEVCLSGFCYDRFEEAAAFTPYALDKLLGFLGNRLLIFSAITKLGDDFYNIAYALTDSRVVHAQSKAKLFTLGAEHEHFSAGESSNISPFLYNGLRIGILLCFELRFKELWQQLEGCDIIAIPAQWGKIRGEHFVTLTNALAVLNQCYVIASDAANEDTSAMSGIINPFGHEVRNNGMESLTSHYEERTLQSMRRYLNTGIGQ